MIILANMDGSIAALDKALSFMIPYLMFTFGLACFIFVLFLPVILYDIYNKRKMDKKKEENRLMDEDVHFIYKNNKHNETIKMLTEETKELLKTKAVLQGQIEELEGDVKKAKKAK